MFCNTLSMFEPGLFLFKEYAVLLEENENLQRQFQVCFFEMSIFVLAMVMFHLSFQTMLIHEKFCNKT